MPDTSQWSQASAYDYWDELPLEGLAWEFLRRNKTYQRDYASGTPNPSRWGLRTPADPAITAIEAPVYWSPTLTSGELLLAALSVPTAYDTVHIAAPFDTVGDDAFGVIGNGASELHVSFLDTMPSPDLPLCVIIPLDGDMPDRIDALQRLWRLLHNKPAPDQRLSREKRHRLRQMIRAADGRESGASAREIAVTLFGKHRVAEQDWRTSSLRYMTLRLLRDGEELIAGGYRDLLHSGRNDARLKQLAAPRVRR